MGQMTVSPSWPLTSGRSESNRDVNIHRNLCEIDMTWIRCKAVVLLADTKDIKQVMIETSLGALLGSGVSNKG
jgi:hypothetical protein